MDGVRLTTARTPVLGEVEVESVTTSLRAVVGKNLFALGLMGGVGWDWYDGDAEIRANLPTPGLSGVGTGSVSSE